MVQKHILLMRLDREMEAYLADFIPCLGLFQLTTVSQPMDLLAKLNAYHPALVICDLDQANQRERKSLLDIFSKHLETKTVLLGSDDTPHGRGRFFKKEIDFNDFSAYLKEALGVLENPPAPNREKARMLIAEDEADLAALLRDCFEPLGIEIEIATDGRQALEALERKTCNLAILDINMPYIDGMDLIRRIHHKNVPEPKLVLITTAGLGSRVDELAGLGYECFIKPCDLDGLIKKVLTACRQHGLLISGPSAGSEI